MSATVPRVHQELADLCATILPGLHGGASRAHTISPDLWAALVTWNPSAPATGLGLSRAGVGQRRASFLDLMDPPVPTAVTLYVPSIEVAPQPAAVRAVAAVKGQTNIGIGGRDEPLANVATWMSVSDELLDDVPQLEGWLARWLRWNVTLGEEQEVLLGPGTPGRVKGFYTRTEIAAVAGASVLDGITAAFADIISTTGLLPDGVVLAPASAGTFLTDAVGLLEWVDGHPTLLGMNLYLCPFALNPLVGAFGAGAVIGRNGTAVVEGTRSHDLDFVKNLSAIRAESRLTLGVMTPGLFRTVTVTP